MKTNSQIILKLHREAVDKVVNLNLFRHNNTLQTFLHPSFPDHPA